MCKELSDEERRARNRARNKAWRRANPDKVRANLEKHRETRSARSRAYNAAHKEQKKAYDKQYYRAHPEKLKYYQERGKERRLQLQVEKRKQVLEHYGNRCACCGETIPEFLTIDHIEGGGTAHRKEIPSNDIYRWLLQHDFPPGFRLLCMNCNFAMRWGKPCPHEEQRKHESGDSKRRRPRKSKE